MHKLTYYNKPWVDWAIRILFVYNTIMPGLNYPSKIYPLNVLLCVLIAFLFYSFRLKTVCLLFLLIALFFDLIHFNHSSC